MNDIFLVSGGAVLFMLGLAVLLFFIRGIFIVDPFSVRKRLEAGKTAQMNLSTKLMETHKDLEDKNRRLNFLSQQIHRANSDLNRLNAMKTKFFHIVTHEMRNPLGIISGYSELLNHGKNESLSPDQKKSLQSITDASKRANVLLKDLTDMVAIETGKFKMRLGQIQVSELLKNALSSLEYVTTSKKIKLQVQCQKNLPSIYADEDRIIQIFINLVTNSAKFTPEGGLINIRACTDEGDSRLVLIEIKDSGMGFNPSENKKIFERFYQSENQDRYIKEKGFGLGLFIVFEIVKAHRGEIWAESEGIGKGAKFSLRLPAWVQS